MTTNWAALELVLLVNGPGELYTWATPLLRELRAQAPALRVVLGLLPCPFASGFEDKAAALIGADAVASVAQTLEFLAGGRKPNAFAKTAHGLVLGLGGDVAFPGRVAQRLGYAAWRYSFEPYWNKTLERLLVHDEKTAAKAKRLGANAVCVGNLTADALTPKNAKANTEDLNILLVPGSRGFQFVHMLPMFAAVAEQIAARYPKARFSCARSGLLSDQDFGLALSAKKMLDFGGVPLQHNGAVLATPNGTQIQLHHEDDRYDLMQSATLALTIPGTNTLELGVAHVPSVVCLPLQKMELFPIENPLRYLGVLPIVGSRLKRALVRTYLQRFRYVSLPNMLAEERIQQELRGDLSPNDIASTALQWLDNPGALHATRERLRETMPKPGAAKHLVGAILERLHALETT